MGSGSSTSIPSTITPSQVKGSRKLSKQFSDNVLKKLSSMDNECANGISKLLVENHSARQAFYEFLLDNEENVGIDSRRHSLVNCLADNDNKAILSNVEDIRSENSAGNGEKNEITAITERPDEDKISLADANECENVTDQFIKLQLLSLLPYFMKSSQYRKWTEKCIAIDTSNALKSTKDIFENDTRTQRIKAFHLTRTDSLLGLHKAQNLFCKLEMSTLNADGMVWLDSILELVETIPICFTMSSARADRPGFPLVYVNKAFERLTSYKREEVIGQNCKSVHNHSRAEQFLKYMMI
jgi:PAS domain-containing protein